MLAVNKAKEAFAADEQAKITFALFSLNAYVFAQIAVITHNIKTTNTSSKLYLNGKTNNLHTIPKRANLGIVDKKAKTEVSHPL